MKQYSFVASAILSFTLVSVACAQAPMKDEIIAPFSWTGFYIGGNLGFVQHTMNITDTEAASFNATIQQTANPDFTGGFQAGYRRQVDLANSSAVFGLELAANFSDSKYDNEFGSPFALYQLRANNSLKNVIVLQALGGLAVNQTFLFLSTGAAWANIHGSVLNLDGLPFFNGFSLRKTTASPVVGGGIEYAFNQRFSARFKLDVIFPEVYSTRDNAGSYYQISNNITQATFGLNYTFG